MPDPRGGAPSHRRNGFVLLATTVAAALGFPALAAATSTGFGFLTAPAGGPVPLALVTGEVRLNADRGCTYVVAGGARRLLAWPAGTSIAPPAGDAPALARLPTGVGVGHRNLIAGLGGLYSPAAAERLGVRGARAEARRCGLPRGEIAVAFAIDSVRPRGTLPLVVRSRSSRGPRARLTGRVVVHEELGCAWLRDRGTRRPAIWPPGTVWLPRRHAIRIPGGPTIRDGDRIAGPIEVVHPGTVLFANLATGYDAVPWRRRCVGVALIPPKQAVIGRSVRVLAR